MRWLGGWIVVLAGLGVLGCSGSTSDGADAHGSVDAAVDTAMPPGDIGITPDTGSTCADADGDGEQDIACGGTDCNDADRRAYPGNAEICDPGMHDEDCDPTTFGVRDADADGWADAACCNSGPGGRCGDDCNDASASVHPSSPEVCDLRDNDCDGSIDEAVVPTFYRDLDADGFGVDTDVVTTECFAPAGYASMSGDCNDSANGVHPGAYDECDVTMRDENCDGVPNNPPGGCSCATGTSQPCPMALGVCATGIQLCTSGTWGGCSVMPSPDEDCDGQDDDCDGRTDESLTLDCFADGDADGYAAAGTPATSRCDPGGACPPLFTTRAPVTALTQDCDDTSPGVSPAVSETCDGVNQDCDASTDEGLPTATYYIDNDGDLHQGTPVVGCRAETGWSPTSSDCNDHNSDVYEGQTQFFGVPNCGVGFPCYVGGVWGCYDTPLCASRIPTDTPSWDYDCNAVAMAPPRMTPTCPSSFMCGEGGWDVTAACGQFLPASGGNGHWYCQHTCSPPCTACGVVRDDSFMPCR